MSALETSFDKLQEPIAKTVCGGNMKDPAGFLTAIYKGERIYFCTRACLRVFEQNPHPFMTGEIDHPIDEE